jgi:NADH-quinone oxidoreductase subunit M
MNTFFLEQMAMYSAYHRHPRNRATHFIGIPMIVLTAVVTPIVVMAMWREADVERRDPKPFFAMVLVLEAMVIGAFAAQDLLLFYILFEAMLVPMYFMIGMYGGPQRRYAAMKFLLYNLLGGLIMLAAVIGVYVQSVQAGQGTFLLSQLIALDIPVETQRWLFLGFMFAFAIKAPLWPFHTWLPDAAAEATPSNAAYLSGIVDKVGTFGMIALCLPLFPDAAREFAPAIVTLAVISILYGALLALGQTDIKRLIAYTSISHFGFIALGIFAFSTQAFAGATLYMVNHGITTGMLFIAIGFVIARGGSRLIGDYGGVHKLAPLLAGTFLRPARHAKDRVDKQADSQAKQKYAHGASSVEFKLENWLNTRVRHLEGLAAGRT